MRTADIDVTIVIVSFRSADLALRSMADAEATARGLSLEEVFVDNGSGDADALRCGRPGATVIALADNRGFAAGVNAALRMARGRHVFLVNPDAFCRDDAVALLVRYLDTHPHVAVAAPKLLNPDGSQQLNAYRRFPSAITVFFDYCFPLSNLLYGGRCHPYVLPRSAYTMPRDVAHAMGAALLVRRAAIEDAGLLDEGFFLYLEETEWQERIAAAGWEIHLEPRATVTHIGGSSTGDYSFASPPFLASLERYHRGSPAVRRAVIMGTGVSWVAARAAQRLRPRDSRFRALGDACAQTLRSLRARRWASS